MNCVREPLETFFRAFAGDHWRDLLYWSSNNVLLHSRNDSRKNKDERLTTYRDLVYQKTMINSSLVTNLLRAFNRVEGNSRAARDERRRLASTIALDFTHEVMASMPWRIPDVGTKYTDRTFTRHMFREARAHALAFQPGGRPFDLPHRKQVVISADQITSVYSYIMVDHQIQKMASGVQTLVLSNGKTLKIGSVARKFLRAHLWAAYARKHTDDNGAYTGGVSRTSFLKIASNATDQDEKCYAALDQIKVRYGSENFTAGFVLVQNICALDTVTFAGYELTLKKLIDDHKVHCKTTLPTHLETHSKCACHCLTHLFGGQGPESSNVCPEACDGHPDRCEPCEAGQVIILMIQGMINKLSAQDTLTAKQIEDLQWRLDKYERNYNQYIGHIIRGYHEIKCKKQVYENLQVGDVIEVSDWKMKFMMLLFRETMPDFFGKSGNPWAGTMFITKTKPGSDLECFYYDGFMNDKKEDAFATLSFLEIVQSHFFTQQYPIMFPASDMTKAHFYYVFLDGAGCYVSAENLLTRLAFSRRCNVYLKAMFIPEAYFNKTPLDGHFAVAGKQMRAAVSSGSSDAHDAASMCAARVLEGTKGEGAKNYVTHFEPNRDRCCEVKSTAMPNIKKMSARIPVWVPNNAANRARLKNEELKASIGRKTVKELKVILRSRSEPLKGLKADLVQRVLDTEPAPPVGDNNPEESDVPVMKYLLSSVRLHRHTGMGDGVEYKSTDIDAMWVKEPQVSTGVEVVQEPIGAGGTVRSKGMGKGKTYTRKGKSRSLPKVRGTASDMKSKRLAAAHEARVEAKDKIQSRSKGFWCAKHGGQDGCNRWFATLKGMRKHQRSDECQSGIQMFRKSSKRVPADRIVNTDDHIKRCVADLAGVVTITVDADTPAPQLYDGVRTDLPGGPYTVRLVAMGYAAKVYRNSVKLNAAQREYLEWCFNCGEVDTGLKVNPRTAAKHMGLHGTTTGCNFYSKAIYAKCNPEYWADRGAPTFRVSLILDHWYIKSWFSVRKSKGKPDALESVRYGRDERVWSFKVDELRDIATHLCLNSEGTKKELRHRIATALSADAGEQFVGKRVKRVNGEVTEFGKVIDKSESVERAGQMIYKVRFEDGEEKDLFLDEIFFTEE